MFKPLLPIAFTASILLTACGGSSSSAPTAVTPSDNKSSVTETVSNEKLGMNLDLSQLKSAGVFADKIIVKITKGDFTKTIETNHTDYAASVEFSDLVIGEYAISVQIFDGETLVAEGSGTGAVNANQTTTVNMDLELKSGGLIVNIKVSEPVEGKESLNIEKTVTTTTDKLEGGPITTQGLLGSIIADKMTHTIYDHEASFGKLEKGSDIKIDLDLSYNNSESDEIEVADTTPNTLNLMHNEITLLSCSPCNIQVEKSADTLVMSYLRIDIPEAVAKSITDTISGENVYEDLFGALIKHQADVFITFKKIDGSAISTEEISAGNLLDKTKYEVTLAITGVNRLNSGLMTGAASYGTLSASSVSQ